MIILVFITTWQRACTGRVLCGSTTLSSPESSATWKKQVDRCGSLDNLMVHIKDRWLMKPPPQKCHLRPPWSKPLRWPACLVAVGPEGVLEVLTDIGWGLALKKEWQSCKRGWWSISRKTKTDQIFLCKNIKQTTSHLDSRPSPNHPSGFPFVLLDLFRGQLFVLRTRIHNITRNFGSFDKVLWLTDSFGKVVFEYERCIFCSLQCRGHHKKQLMWSFWKIITNLFVRRLPCWSKVLGGHLSILSFYLKVSF